MGEWEFRGTLMIAVEFRMRTGIMADVYKPHVSGIINYHLVERLRP